LKTLLAILVAMILEASAAKCADLPPLRVLANSTAGFIFLDQGAPSGLEYEILAYYARASGRRLEVRWIPKFEDLLPALQQGKGDVAAANLSITPERRDKFAFTVPYFTVRVVLVERKGKRTTRLDQLRGERLATIRGTTYETILSAVPDARLVYAERVTDLLDLVAKDQARATVADSLVALRLLPQYPQLEVSMPVSDLQGYGFALPKGSPLAGELSSHIERLRSSSIYFRLLEKYLGKDAAALVTAAHR
jgi:ABC-type amino acid transport substrate-binding protein